MRSEWELKYLFAKEFGWTLEYIDSLDYRKAQYILDVMDKIARDNKQKEEELRRKR
jgi:hypothetical protein